MLLEEIMLEPRLQEWPHSMSTDSHFDRICEQLNSLAVAVA